MHLRELFATNVRLIRHERKLSHKQLAHDTQIDRIYVSRVERAVTYVGLKIIGKLATILGGRAGRVLPTALPGPDSEGRPAQPHAELGRLLKADYPSFPRAFNLPAVFSGRGEQMGIGRSPLLASQCNLCRAGPARPTGHRSMASVTLRAPPA